MPRGKHGLTNVQARKFLERVALGDTIAQAAEYAGPAATTFYSRANPASSVYDKFFAELFAEAIEQRAAIRADRVDGRFDDWIDEQDCPPALRLAWAKRWNPAFRDKQQVELTGANGGPQELVVRHDTSAIVAMLEEVGLVRRVDAEALDGPGPAAILPARTD